MQLTLKITPELELKPLSGEDAAKLFELTEKNRTYLRRWLAWLDRTQTVEDSAGYIEFAAREALSGAGYVFALWKSGALVGVHSFQNISKANRSANIGYWISQEHSGQGLARIATKTMIDHAFSDLKLHRIEIRCASENYASQKVAEACGLKYEGFVRNCEWLYDHFVDHKVYGILSTDPR